MTKEQINKLETEIETIITNNAQQIIEGGYSTIADYLRDKKLVSKDAESLLVLYNYLPFSDYITTRLCADLWTLRATMR